MKKLLSSILIVFLLVSMIPLASASDTHSGFLLKMIDCTAPEWEADNSTHALFTACALMDLLIITDETEDAKITEIAAYAASNDGIAFARNSSIVVAIFCGAKDSLVISYQPSSNEFIHMYSESNSSYSMSLKLSMFKQVIEEDNGNFYEVSSTSYYQYLQKIADIISN